MREEGSFNKTAGKIRRQRLARDILLSKAYSNLHLHPNEHMKPHSNTSSHKKTKTLFQRGLQKVES